MVQTTTNGKFLSRTHQPEREFAQAIKTAVERCPEYADALSTLSEARFATRLYADACGQLKAQYRELAAEHLRLQQDHSEVHAKAVMIADFLGYMSRRLKAPAERLQYLGSALSESLTGDRAGQARDLLSTVGRLMEIITDLVQVAETMCENRTPLAPKKADGVTSNPTEAVVNAVRPVQQAMPLRG